jgi:hypothetical protein
MSKIFISHLSAKNAVALAAWEDHFLDITPTRGLASERRVRRALTLKKWAVTIRVVPTTRSGGPGG